MASFAQGMAGTTEGRVRAEQVRTLYRQNVWILAANPLNAAIVAAVLWSSTPHWPLLAWVLASAIVAGARTRLRHAFIRAAPSDGEAPRWGRRAVIGATVAGTLWGTGALLFYSPAGVVSQLMFIFVIGGMVAGASGSLATHLSAFLGYAATATLPLAGRMVAQGDGLHVAMGALTVVFGVVMAAVASNTHRAVTQAFRLRFENHDLLERLSRAQTSLADANRTLEERVAERGAALERQTETLREAQRMESVGLLAGGVAHDFNNLLTAVMGNVELLLRERGVSADKRESLEEIQEAARRGANLVSQLLAFSRRQVAARRVVDLNAVMTEAQRLLGRLIGEDIELVIALRQGPLPVMADPTQLHQIVINLATNARDAMPDGGKLTIETAVVDGGTAGVPVTPGTYAMLSVQDTGTGMDAETRRMAFHPFFTTKEVGRGTGLGLATVYGIVEQCGGRVFVDSAPGQGSCFRVFLPYLEKAALDQEGTTAERRPPTPARRSATVLLAEDEPLVRSVTARILTGAGFTVIAAENGEHALDLARRHAGAIDLLVSDMVMPKLGGVELARRLREERPGTPVLLVSGYNREGMSPAEAASRNIALLQKPFDPQDLVETALRLLDGATAPGTAASLPDLQASDLEGDGRRSS